MSDKDLQLLAALHALGASTPAEEEKLSRIVSSDQTAANLASEYREAAQLLSLSLEPVQPPPHILDSLRLAIAEEGAGEEAGIRVTRAGEGWENFALEGIRVKRLTREEESGPVTVLMTFDPGARYPAHTHTGAEQCLVVSGSFESGGHVRRTGDFIYAEAGSSDDEMFSFEGATLLVVMAPEDFAKASQA